MSTINISLPTEQVNFIDQLVDKLGFANRSELVRSVFRFLKHNPEALAQTSAFPFAPPVTKNSKQIVKDFRSSGKYSAAFLKDLEEGLKRSDYFKS